MFVSHREMEAMTPENTPVAVQYCALCGLPTDYCKYGPMWDKHPAATASAEEGEKAGTQPAVAAPVIAKAPAGATVMVKIAPRVGRRYLTTITGLDQFDVDIAKACKVFAKKFACGVGKKEDSGEIEIQGDVEDSIVATITSNWKNIKAKHIVIKRKEKS